MGNNFDELTSRLWGVVGAAAIHRQRDIKTNNPRKRLGRHASWMYWMVPTALHTAGHSSGLHKGADVVSACKKRSSFIEKDCQGLLQM